MKYEYYPKRRTEQERRELNEQILRLLQSEACEQAGVTDEDIFNRYTGDGGLHGLRRSDYENYNAFSAAKKELENGQFFTPPPLCEMIVSALRLSDTDLAADLTCGMGNFFNFLSNERNAYGCEVDPNACAVARKLYPQAHIVQGDIRDYEPQTHFDFVLGNPPFHLRWIMPDATVMTSHQYYCLKAAKLLKPLGILAVIVPASFLADSFSDKGAIRMMESRFSFLLGRTESCLHPSESAPEPRCQPDAPKAVCLPAMGTGQRQNTRRHFHGEAPRGNGSCPQYMGHFQRHLHPKQLGCDFEGRGFFLCICGASG